MMDVVDDDARGDALLNVEAQDHPAAVIRITQTFAPTGSPRTSTSNTSVEPGGMSGGAPASPYAIDGGNTSFRRPPTFMPLTPRPTR